MIMTVAIDNVKKLRKITGAPIMECYRAINKAKGDFKKAKGILKKLGLKRVEKKDQSATSQGIVTSYIHHNKRAGCLLELSCETDFVAKTDDFVSLTKEIAMQVVSMNPDNVDELLKQEYIRDSKMTVSELIKVISAKLGENIKVKRFARYELGEDNDNPITQ